MRTLVIWSDIPEEIPKFFVTKEDVSNFSGCYINNIDDESLEREMIKFFYSSATEEGKFRFEFSIEPPNVTEFDKVIACGFIG